MATMTSFNANAAITIISAQPGAMTAVIDGEWVSVTDYFGEARVGDTVIITHVNEAARRFRRPAITTTVVEGIIVELHAEEIARVYAGGAHWWMDLRSGEVLPVE